MAEPDEKFDRFKPAVPKIPGVPEGEPAAAAPGPAAKRPPMAVLAGGGAAVLVVLVLLIWWAMRPAPKAAPEASSEGQPAAVPGSTSPGSPKASAEPLPTAPGEVATVNDLAKPWSSKRFLFRKLFGDELVVGVVLRLPSASARAPQGYWGFAAGVPNQPCELEVVSDTKRLAEEFGYRASHAMVVNPCNHAVYDPLRLADVAGVWVRGEVVAGPGGRPPLSILIRVEGNSVIASQME